MTVHVGEVTSEVHATATVPGDEALPDSGPAAEWEERARLAARLGRVTRDRYRTATGHGHD